MLIGFDRAVGALDMMRLSGWVVLVGFVLALVAGAIALPLLRRLRVRQHAYEDAPATHQVKSGTPTIGGIVFVVALLPLVLNLHVPFVGELFGVVALCALVGFIDDMLGVVRGKNAGLRARTKFLATALIAVIFLRQISSSYGFFPRDAIFHAGSYALIAPHWLWLLLGILAITGTIHAVNLTDGLDGLATGSIVPPLALLALVGFQSGLVVPTEAALLGVGACIAFLVFNHHPAKLIMGDTGSLALGALLAATAILTGEMLLLLLIGGVFVAEAASVMLQVGYFKLTQGKRIFRMSPLHHHFELGGLPETVVTRRFWLVSLLCSVVGWAIVR